MKDSTRAAAGVTLALATWLSCTRDTAVFRFQPEAGAVYEVVEVEEIRQTTTARAGIELERREMEARFEVRRPDSWRWAFVMTPQRVEVEDQGVMIGGEHPLVKALVGSPLTIEVWEDGTVAGVGGFEEVDRKLLAALGRSGGPPMLGLTVARQMEAEIQATWAERVAPLIGREAAVGERWEQTLERPLPTGGSLQITRELTFEGWEECGPSRCARLRHVERGGGAEWSAAIETILNQFALSLCPNAERVEVLEVTISGEGESLVEPGTLFTSRESEEQKVALRVRLDDGKEQVVSREAKRTFSAERKDGDGPGLQSSSQAFRNPATGRFVEPAPGQLLDAGPQRLTAALSTSAEGLVEEPVSASPGGVRVSLRGRFRSATFAERQPDGALAVECGGHEPGAGEAAGSRSLAASATTRGAE
jgi:hypothetical protein